MIPHTHHTRKNQALLSVVLGLLFILNTGTNFHTSAFSPPDQATGPEKLAPAGESIENSILDPSPSGESQTAMLWDFIHLSWSSPETLSKSAWGDVDNDGKQDMLAGYANKALSLFHNDGSDHGQLSMTPVWTSAEVYSGVSSLAWGDVDKDGFLDLAAGDSGGPVKIYMNQKGALSAEAAYTLPDNTQASMVAWGDYDGDHALDLAVGSDGGVTCVFRNVNGRLSSSPTWQSASTSTNRPLTWVDVDHDGYADLAAGNEVYHNGQGALAANPWFTLNGWRFAWGDINGDGLADYAAGGSIFINQGTVGGIPAFQDRLDIQTDSYIVSTALADIDNDGKQDLIVGSTAIGAPRYYPISVYRNDSLADGTIAMTLAWWTPVDNDTTSAVQAVDVDSDGYLDLAAENEQQPARLYRNANLALTLMNMRAADEVALGDVNRDGYLDVAVNYAVLINHGGEFPDMVDLQNAGVPAWGDYNKDGFLDLTLSNHLYTNHDGALSLSEWTAVENGDASSVAWGDYDGDGYLDLAIGNRDQPVRVYHNQGGSLSTSATWSAPASYQTSSIAWGDVDNDGDLDLAVGNYGAPTQLYQNRSGSLDAGPAWQSVEAPDTTSIAWGDYDGDGDLDLASGNDGQPIYLYRNDHGQLSRAHTWASVTADETMTIAWGDVDNDGDLDLASGCQHYDYSAHVRIFRNEDHQMNPLAGWAAMGGRPRAIPSLAWGDVDGDGDLDLIAADFRDGISYRNQRDNQGMFNAPPVVRVYPPGVNANFYADPVIYGPQPDQPQSNVINIAYTVVDQQGRPARAVRAQFSPDGGGIWYPAVATAGSVQNTINVPSNIPQIFQWDVAASGFTGQSDNVVFRMMVFPSDPASYLFGSNAAQTYPFRVRGEKAGHFTVNLPMMIRE